MNVPKSFVDLIYSKSLKENYIGMGNPNAKILVIGREPAHDLNTEEGREAHRQDQELNRNNWQNLIVGNPVEGRCNPRRPFPNQRCFPQNESGQGTSNTWIWYQKLIDLILGREYDRGYMLRPVDFHDFCFHTDISSASAKSLATTNKKAKELSVEKRSEELFGKDFFKQFPITILAIGKDVGSYVSKEWCEQVLGFPREEVIEKTYIDEKGHPQMIWLNKDSRNHRILVHTRCLSQNVSYEYIGKLRDLLWEEGFGNSNYCWPSAY